MHPAEKIYARCHGLQKYLLRMQGKPKIRFQKSINLKKNMFQVCSIGMQKHEIIRVANVAPNFNFSFHELIEFVHIHIDEELTCEVPERQPYVACAIHTEAADNLSKKPERGLIRDPPAENIHQNLMINVGEEFPNVALEHPCRACVIPGDLTRELLEAIHCLVRTFAFATRIGVVDEQAFVERADAPIDSMMHQTILHGCFMNVARFGIINAEGMVRAMSVRLLLQLLVKGNDAVREMHRIVDDVLAISLSAQKFFPCGEQIRYRNDMLVTMRQTTRTLSLSLSKREHRPSRQRGILDLDEDCAAYCQGGTVHHRRPD